MEEAESIAVGLLQDTAAMEDNVLEDDFQTDVNVEEQKEVIGVEKTELITEKPPQGTPTNDKDVEEHAFQTYFCHVDSQKEVVGMEKAELFINQPPKSMETMDEDVNEDDFQTDFVHVDEQKEKSIADKVQDVVLSDSILVEDKILINKEMQEEDVVDDLLEVPANKQKEVATANKAHELSGAESGVNEEKAGDITEKMLQSIGTSTMDEGHFEIDFVQADEPTKVDTTMEDKDVQKENACTCESPHKLDTAKDSNDHINSALLDDVTKALSKITIIEPAASRDKDIPLMCKSSSEKNFAETVCKNSSGNTAELVCQNSSNKNIAELVSTQEKKGTNVVKKSEDLTNLSLRQLRLTLKNRLQGKDEKRVPLGRVDENVCRSKGTGQDQIRNLQQY